MTAANPNADPILLDLIDLAKTSGKLDPLLRASAATPGFALAGTGATVVGDRIALDILLQDGAEADAAQAALEAAGMTGVQVDGRAASGWIDADALPALDALDVVAFARLVYGQAHTGSVGAEGSLAINADAGRADFGVDGSGVAVGALSDSFNALSGAQSDIASGDLPTVVVLEDSAGTDEGRAMLQIVHDVAPGADLLFHTANGGQANFAQGIRDLAAAGASVIVDDIVYLAEPFFQDGLVSRAVDDVFADGVAYFSSAGNAARDSYEAAFVGSGQALTLQGSNGPVDFGEMHDFDPGAGVDVRQRVTVPNGGDLFITFQWDQPFASVSSGGRASASDLDILLFGAAGGLETANLFDLSASFNVGGDPVEVFRFVNNTASTQFDLVITHFSGPEAGLLKYVDLGRATISEHDTNSGATFGHAPAAGGLGVGAAFWGQTPNNGQSPPLLESFSSAGPTTILFADDGARLAAPEIRASPDVVGPDGTNNTFFGQDIAFDADTAPNFFGTSAAAPHVAAVAALMLEANPLLTPAEIYAALQSTAIDMGVAGFDEDSGFGLVDAAAALAAIVPTGPTEGADALTGTPDADTLNGLGGDDIILGLGADDVLIGGPGADQMIGGLGADEMIGGPGDDLYDVDDVGDAVVELESEGIDTVVSAIDFALPDFVENLRLNGIGLSGTGNGLANIILGGAGDDILNGGAGDDVLTGGAGADAIDGGGGVDRVDYAAESGGGAVAADLLAGTATDTFGDSDTLVGILNVRAGAGGDTLRGDDGANVLDGGAGGDRLVGHGGADTLIGGGDRDRVDYSYESGGGAVFADFATGVFIDTHGDTDSLVEVESITGGAAADRLFGDAGDNGLSGAAGDDLIVGRAGADTLVGGDGFDTLDYAQDGGAGAVTVDLAARSATDTHGDTDFVFGFEEVIGTDQADVLMGDALANRFFGGAGDDTLQGGDGDDELQGGAGADSMDGGLGDDIYRVEAAGDRILDAGGVDRVEASIDFGLQFGLENLTLLAGATRGSGNSQANHLIGSDSDDVLLGGAGDDLLEGGAGADALAGHAGADQLNGGDGDDTLLGREGDDVLTGGAGADLMVGGLGNDLYIVDSLADRVVEDADGGADAVQSGITYRLAANVEDLTLTGAGAIDGAGNSSANGVVGNDSANVLLGGAGDDILTGGGGGDAIAGHVGADQLNGGAGDDVLLGREGDDILTGGAGQDRLLGGAGVDRFVFNPGDGADTVVDYVNGVDRLAFLGFGFADANAVLALASAVGADIRFDLADGGVVLVEGAAALGVAAGDLLV